MSDDEILWRRVSERSQSIQPGPPERIGWEVFRPNRRDTSGISVWRARFFRDENELIARLPAQAGNYFLLALIVRDVRNLGITISETEEEGGDIPGHASLATLNHGAYQRDKDRVRELAESLTTIARILGPFEKTESSDR